MRYKRLEIGVILAVFVGYISDDNRTDRGQKRLEPKQITSNLIGIKTY